MPGSAARPLAALLVLFLTACSGSDGAGSGDADTPPDGPAPDTVVDALGRTVALDRSPERIVSLVPAATSTLQALGAEHLLAGRTDYDTASAIREIPSVGGGLHPTLEVLLSLVPDLVVRFAGETDLETPHRLDEADIPHVAVRPETVEGVWDMIHLLGTATRRRDAADSIVSAHRKALETIRDAVRPRAPVRVAFLVGGSPLWAVGTGTFLHQILEAAGGENVFGDLGRPYAGVSPEALVARQPDVVLLVEGVEPDGRLLQGAEVRTVPASVQLPGPDLDRIAWDVARALHPGLAAGDGTGGRR